MHTSFDPPTATRLLLSEHVIQSNLWIEFDKAMVEVGLERNSVYQHVAAVASGHRATSAGKRKAEEELPNPAKSQRGEVESMDDG